MLTKSQRLLHAWPQVSRVRSCPLLIVAVQVKAFLKHTNSLREPATRAALQTISNSMAITDGNDKKIGIGVYLFSSLFNHSCQPNCVVSFSGVLLITGPLHFRHAPYCCRTCCSSSCEHASLMLGQSGGCRT
jgi:hypothetical protein